MSCNRHLLTSRFTMDYFTLRRNFLTLFIICATCILKPPLATTHDIRVVCYVGTWSLYHLGRRAFDTPNIDANLCTHIVYSFIGIDNTTGTITSIDENRDIARSGFKDFVDLKKNNSNLKVLIAIGGWNEGPAKFSRIASSKKSRQVFIQSALEFLRKYKFDGLDIAWAYPGYETRGGNVEDKENLNLLVQELRESIPGNWTLSIAIASEMDILVNGYDLKTLSKDIDFFNVLSYDYHGNWENTTGPNSPLYSRPDENIIEKSLNVNFTVHFLMRLGIPRDQIVVGFPMFGRAFVLENYNLTKPGSPTIAGEGDGNPLGYNELCSFTEDDGWIRERDEFQMVPYMYRNYTWISYDDPQSVFTKAKFVLENDLGGAMVWSLDTDDFLGTCSKTKFLLLDAILKGLGKRPVTGDSELTIAEPSSSIKSSIPFFSWLVSISVYLSINFNF